VSRAERLAEIVTEQPRRLTPTERLHEVTMQAMGRRPAEPESSVTISRNAKGQFQFEVTVRGGSIDECHKDAQQIAHMLSTEYPYSVNGGNE
jgi:hypothetical protein